MQTKDRTNKVWTITEFMITCLWKCVSGNVTNSLSEKTGREFIYQNV